MALTLTHNAILQLNGGEVDLRPFLQVMDVRQIGNAQSTQERFRLVLSDGVHVQQAMLATQLNEHVKNKEVLKGTIVQLTEYICNTVQNRKIIIVLNMEIVQSLADIIGDPRTLASGSEQLMGGPAQSSNLKPPQQQQQQQHQTPPPPQQHNHQAPPQQQQHHYQPPPPQQQQQHPLQPPPPQQRHQQHYQQPPPQHHQQHYNQPSPQQQRGPMASGGSVTESGGFSHGRSYQPPPAMYSSKGPIARNEAPARIVPISALNPYQGRWTIKARVTSKGDVRRFNNARGDGKVFSFDLLDADGGEIRCTCFNNVADLFYEKVIVGRVYLVTKGSLKPAQKQFNHLKNEWEIALENTSTVEPCLDEDDTIPQQQFDFKPISDVENMENNAMVDIVGVVLSIQDTVQIMRKNGTETTKRTLLLSDKSRRSVEVTMWAQFCNKEGNEIQQEVSSGTFPILVVKAGRVSDFSGKSVGTLNTSQLLINPDIPEAHRLRDWHDREGKNTTVQSISKEGGGSRSDTRKFVKHIKDENLGRNEKPDWISIRATIVFLKADTFCYTACPLKFGDKQCSKKVSNNGDGTWRCDRCDQSVPECDYRYLLQMQVQDHSGGTWLSAFQEAGEEIFGVSAKDLFMWKQDDNPRFGDAIQKVIFSTHLFKLKVKEETFQDEARVKSTVVKSEKVNFVTESKLLLDSIYQFDKPEFQTAGQSTPVGFTANTTTTYGGGGTPHVAPSYNNSSFGTSTVQGGRGVGGGGYNAANGSSSTMYGGFSGPKTNCFKCGKDGHFANSCPGRNDSFRGGTEGGSANPCFRCGQGGHFAKDCPNQGSGSGNFGSSGGFGGSGYGGRGF